MLLYIINSVTYASAFPYGVMEHTQSFTTGKEKSHLSCGIIWRVSTSKLVVVKIFMRYYLHYMTTPA